MAGSRTPAPTDPGSAAPSLGMATVRPFYPSIPFRFTDVALWTSVIRGHQAHSLC